MVSAQAKRLYHPPNKQTQRLAADSGRILSAHAMKGDSSRLLLIEQGTEVAVPVQAMYLFVDILQQMAQGNTVSITSTQAELTTQQAADRLHVSRPFLIDNILNTGKLPFHKVGNRRKILLQDVLDYQALQRNESAEMLADLAHRSQDLQMMD